MTQAGSPDDDRHDILVKPSRLGLGWFLALPLLVVLFGAGAFVLLAIVGSSMLAVFVYSFGFMAIVGVYVLVREMWHAAKGR
jgi:hypothetical protein